MLQKTEIGQAPKIPEKLILTDKREYTVIACLNICVILLACLLRAPLLACFTLGLFASSFYRIQVIKNRRQVRPYEYAIGVTCAAILCRVVSERSHIVLGFVCGFLLNCAYLLCDYAYRGDKPGNKIFNAMAQRQ